MADLYDDNIKGQIDDLFAPDVEEPSLEPPTPIKEEKEPVRVGDEIQEMIYDLFENTDLNLSEVEMCEVVEPFVDHKPVDNTKPVLEESKESNTNFVEDIASKMSQVHKRTNVASGQERITEEQLTLNNFQVQIDGIRRALRESTLVSGIGQGGDGQTPGSGEVKLARMDDVSIENLNPGDVLVWNGNKFVPGSSGVNDADVVSSIKPGVGIDVVGTIPPGKGDVTIALDASINDLNDVDTSTVSEGQTLLYSGGSWGAGGVTTAQVDLTNPSGNPFSAVLNYPRYNSITPQNVYTTQEDANQLFGSLINDLDDRVGVIENATKPGTFLGLIDVTDAANEPDNSTLNQGDYYIHDGATGPLWGTGDSVENGDSVIWNGATWEIIATTTTLSQLGDVNISNPISDQMLVYDDSNARWYNESVTIPKVFIDTVMPAGQGEKDGDFWLKNDENILHIYDSIWTEVSGAGGGASFGSIAPTDNEPGDLWIDTDDYNMYAWDGEQWFDLTGGAGGDAAFVTLGDLNATVDTVNFNISQVQNNLGAAVVGLDATHLRITPQAPLAGPLTLSSDLLFDGTENQIISVDNAKSLKIKGTDANGNSRTFIDVQNVNSSGSDGADDGYRVKMYHVADPTSDHHVANKKYVDEQAGSGVPVGSIMIWMNSTAPPGWFKLQGGSFNTSTYPLLHAYLQNTGDYTSGKLPDWSGHFPGEWGGTNGTGQLNTKQGYRTGQPSGGPPKSSHQFNDGSQDTANKAGGTHYADVPTRKVEIDQGWDDVTRPNTILVHYIIKHD